MPPAVSSQRRDCVLARPAWPDLGRGPHHRLPISQEAMSARRVLVVNTGSSSLKFKLYDLVPSLQSTISGLMERIGDPSNSTVMIKVYTASQGSPLIA